MGSRTVGPRAFDRSAIVAPALVLVLLLGGLGAVGSSIGPAATAPRAPAAGPAPAPLPFGGGPHPLSGGLRPLASNEFYTQIGATLSALNASYTVSQVGALSEVIRLVSSPYPTAYELNVLTTTGDWYQITVSDNWPSCASGFEELYQIWNNQDQGQPVVCDPAVSLHLDDLVRLNASLPSSSTFCLGLTDLTTKASHVFCQAQLDPSATGFTLLSRASNSNGYYTGTMTEVVNLTATSCPDYRHLPTVTFDFPSWAHVSQAVAWSDEWDNVQNGPFCYSYQNGWIDLGADPASQYLDATGGSTYGPQIVEGMNASLLNSSVGFRFQTDPVQLTGETVNASASVVPTGTQVNFSATTSGGVPPYGPTLWSENGSWVPGAHNATWSLIAGPPGNDTIVAYGTDAQGNAIASAPFVLRVPYPLALGALSVQPGPGMDVGEAATIGATVSGGDTPLQFNWSGLPPGCASANQASILCQPTTAGNFTVALRITQANGSTAGPISFVLTVSPALILAITSDRTVADVGQTATFHAVVQGGAGGERYVWAGLPGGCSATGILVPCTFTQPGSFAVDLAVTDANQVTGHATPLDLTVSPDLQVSVAVSRPVVDAGTSFTVSARTTGGSGGLTYTWTSLPAGCVASDTASFACTPTTPGTANVAVTATDRANGTAGAIPVLLTVAPALEVTLTANRTEATAPAAFALTPTIVQGSTVHTINWTGLPPGCHAGGLSTSTCSGLGVGSYLVGIQVVDIGGGHASATLRLNVTAPPPPPVPSHGFALPSPLVWLLLLTLGVAIVVAVGLGRRRAGGSGGAPPGAEDGWNRPITGTETDEF